MGLEKIDCKIWSKLKIPNLNTCWIGWCIVNEPHSRSWRIWIKGTFYKIETILNFLGQETSHQSFLLDQQVAFCQFSDWHLEPWTWIAQIYKGKKEVGKWLLINLLVLDNVNDWKEHLAKKNYPVMPMKGWIGVN